MKKRILAILLAALLIFASCGKTGTENSESNNSVDTASQEKTNNNSDEDEYKVSETDGGFITLVNSKSVRFLGRVLQNFLKGRSCFAYGSSGVEFTFTGTKLSLQLYTSKPTDNADNQLRMSVFIDDMDEAYKTISLKDREEWYDIASGLSDTEHTVKVVRISEYAEGYNSVVNIKTDKATVKPTQKKEYFIEFVGDSISAGHGNEGNASQSVCNALTNTEKTYCAYTAKALDADYSIIAKSGASIKFGADGSVGGMPAMYVKKDFYNAFKTDNEWNWEANQPDVVVVNLGTNDYWGGFYNKNADDSKYNDFINAYVEFIKTIREKNPKALIIAALGPMSYDLMEQIESAVEIVNKDGDSNVISLKLEPEGAAASDGKGTENHPSVITNQKMAKTLIKAIRQQTGIE